MATDFRLFKGLTTALIQFFVRSLKENRVKSYEIRNNTQNTNQDYSNFINSTILRYMISYLNEKHINLIYLKIFLIHQPHFKVFKAYPNIWFLSINRTTSILPQSYMFKLRIA